MRLSPSARETLRHAESLSRTEPLGLPVDSVAELNNLLRAALARARAVYLYDLYREHVCRSPRWRGEAEIALRWRDDVGPEAGSALFDHLAAGRMLGFYEAEFLQLPRSEETLLSTDLWFVEAVWLVEAAEAFVEHSGSQRVAEEVLSQVASVLDVRPDLRSHLREQVRFERSRVAHRGWVLELLDVVEGV
jgi:hypothetical protein